MPVNNRPMHLAETAQIGAKLMPLVVTSVAVLACAFVVMGSGFTPAGKADDGSEDTAIAGSLATLLSASLTVISNNQDLIDNPNIEDKGLDGKTVLARAQQIYQQRTGSNPLSVDANSRHGRLLRVEMAAISDVMTAHQNELNQRGIGFKGFIPATFGRLVTESFGRGAEGDAEIKITAPPELIRNRKARPDNWETTVIREKLLSSNWPKGQFYAALAESKGRPAFRVAAPEYYSASCLSCHGSPKGEIDITGYPKEGRSEGELGGVISITLYR
jgi:Protein of unknown function (DUF3365)